MNLAHLDSLAGRLLEILWRASWQAALLAGMVLIVQWLLRGRLSARWRYNLWLLVLLRLLIPVTPQSSLSVFNLSNHFRASSRAPSNRSRGASSSRARGSPGRSSCSCESCTRRCAFAAPSAA